MVGPFPLSLWALHTLSLECSRPVPLFCTPQRQAVTGARLSVLGSASFADQYQRAMHSDFTTGIFIDTLNANNHGTSLHACRPTSPNSG